VFGVQKGSWGVVFSMAGPLPGGAEAHTFSPLEIPGGLGNTGSDQWRWSETTSGVIHLLCSTSYPVAQQPALAVGFELAMQGHCWVHYTA
jgi:hypothetical protein